ncbi:MAG: hypothetical protein N3A01_06320 [Bacteroidales bacterium]|nr:hypothetical protein [Bacteroidales bacterium]
MVPLKEKLDIEKNNKNKIILYKEGVFWRAYGVSCLLFYRLFPHIKVLANKTSTIGYVFIGIPNTKIEEYHQKLLEKQAYFCNVKEHEQVHVPMEKLTLREYILNTEIATHEYEEFLHNQLHKQKEKEKPTKIVVVSDERIAYVIQKIKSINIENLKPVDALVELKEIKDYINGLGI